MSTTFLDRAKVALRYGIPVVPALPKAKATIIGSKEATTDAATIENWDKQNSDYNSALVAQAKIGGIWILDCDSPEVREQIEKATGKKLPDTFTVQSASAGHRYFRQNEESLKRLKNFSGKKDGKEFFSVRFDNMYCVGPLSIHPSGAIYKVVRDAVPVEAPSWLIDWLVAQMGEEKPQVTASLNGPMIPRGSHDTELTRIAGKLRAAGMEEESMTDALIEVCEKRCENYGNDYREMCQKIAHSICKKPVGDGSIQLTSDGKTAEEIVAQSQTVPVTQDLIDANFPRYDGKPSTKPRMLIDGFLMGGANFFGSLSGIGKSWIALAVAKALVTGEPLFGVFPVKEKVPALYLIPESDESDFKYRLGVMRMPENSELFRYRTISQGQTLALTNELVLAAIKELHHNGKYPRVLVIVDTAVRFMIAGKDMSSATNNNLSNDAERLLSPEISADILFLHHSPKAASKADVTLQTALRDTSDFGAMANCVWALQRDEKLFDYGDGPEEFDMINVKFRGPDKPRAFRLRLKRGAHDGENDGRPVSVIDELGTLEYVNAAEHGANLADRLEIILRSDPNKGMRALKDELRMRSEKIKELAASCGWKQRPVDAYDPATRRTKKHFIWTQIGVAPARSTGANDEADVIDLDAA